MTWLWGLVPLVLLLGAAVLFLATRRLRGHTAALEAGIGALRAEREALAASGGEPGHR